MTRTMGDSVSPSAIPADQVQIVAVYSNGKYAANGSEIDRLFPPGKYVRLWIDIDGTRAGTTQVLDVENGDATIPTAVEWVQSHKLLNHGNPGTVYVNRSNKSALIAACTSAGQVAGRDYWLWVATLDGSMTDLNGAYLPDEPGVVAVQRDALGSWDRSVVTANGWYPLVKPPVKVTADLLLKVVTPEGTYAFSLGSFTTS